jgi:hypothetical protein
VERSGTVGTTVGARERIDLKMLRSSNAGYRSIKRVVLGERGRGNQGIDEIYTPVFRARGV